MRLVPHNPAGEASEGRDQSAGYARRSHFHAIADVGSIPTVSTLSDVAQTPAVRMRSGVRTWPTLHEDSIDEQLAPLDAEASVSVQLHPVSSLGLVALTPPSLQGARLNNVLRNYS